MVVVATLNGGSSSLKYALYQFDRDAPTVLAAGSVDGRGDSVVDAAFDAVVGAAAEAPLAIGHRVVHGGPHHDRPALVDDELLDELRRLVPFAPLHLPGEIRTIEAAARRFPGIRQVACFDTAFHRRLPELAERLPLPRRYFDDGIRRYGFHGLSYEYVSGAIDASGLGRVVIAHLGSGASMVALRDGLPRHTTMSFTPTTGLVMGTRCGDLDPGVVLHLLRQGAQPDAVEHVLNEESGLLGLSGTTSDMRALLTARAHDPAAALAVAAFVQSAAMHVGALTAALDGLDALVFTGGIGAHAAPVRTEVCAALGHLGVPPVSDAAVDDSCIATAVISPPGAAVTVMVVPTNEELVIARHTYELAAR